MYIEIDDKSGFCFGVVKAITKAEESLAELGKVFSLGDIVHNRVEVQRLEKLGLETIAHSHFPELDGQTVLIRAHGEPPTTYALAAAHRIRLIDATCPVVARLQTLVKKAHEQMSGCNGQVVILGKRGHAEVVGLTGQVDGDAIVIETLDDLDNIDFTRPVYLLSQTTQSLALFEEVHRTILERSADPSQVTVNDTICRQVSNRNPHLKEFVRRFDVVIFVGSLSRESAVSNLYGSQSALLQHRGRTRTAKRVVRRLPIGRHLRRDIHPEMADAASRRHDP